MKTQQELEANYEKFIQILKKYFKGERLEKLLHMYSEEELGSNLAVSPASGSTFYHNAYIGGYIDHIFNVTKNALKMRDLFVAPDGYLMLGCDAAALEGRIQAHYIIPYKGGHELADLILNGDIHQANADLWGCTRKEAKSPYYALMYGAQAPKIAQTMGCTLKEAEERYNAFWGQYKPLAMFKDDITKAWESRGGKKGGFLRGLDGRKLFARSAHALVNLMFQSAGSISVKTALLFANNSQP